MKSTYRCSSNIALVKYWGKKTGGIQLPANPSISFTLRDLYTETTVSVEGNNTTGKPAFDFFFEGKPKPSFIPKLSDFFDRVEREYSILKAFRLHIHSSNNFPHGTGIASSASGFGALSCCLAALEHQHTGKVLESEQISRTARMGVAVPVAVCMKNPPSGVFTRKLKAAMMNLPFPCHTLCIVHLMR